MQQAHASQNDITKVRIAAATPEGLRPMAVAALGVLQTLGRPPHYIGEVHRNLTASKNGYQFILALEPLLMIPGLEDMILEKVDEAWAIIEQVQAGRHMISKRMKKKMEKENKDNYDKFQKAQTVDELLASLEPFEVLKKTDKQPKDYKLDVKIASTDKDTFHKMQAYACSTRVRKLLEKGGATSAQVNVVAFAASTNTLVEALLAAGATPEIMANVTKIVEKSESESTTSEPASEPKPAAEPTAESAAVPAASPALAGGREPADEVEPKDEPEPEATSSQAAHEAHDPAAARRGMAE